MKTKIFVLSLALLAVIYVKFFVNLEEVLAPNLGSNEVPSHSPSADSAQGPEGESSAEQSL